MNDIVEFSRPVDMMRLPAGGGHYEIAASDDERAALARRFGLLALPHLAAKIDITRMPGGFYRLAAELEAAPVQACVVTLEPISTRISERFTLLYGPLDEAEDVILDGAAETVEALDDGIIDLGEAVAQQLSLALDPFPHAPDADVQNQGMSAGEPSRASPFAALAQLRKAEER
jgi:uncharacterized metal-binding protein YceD (DUF177 family)